ncbi:murein transglycosylase A [Microvirga lotononidis]|nr:MltA domain-containing protein [Microvirga lotononidis]WQO29044.1 MltA domain-containing protein [Microvirga lotononidis]
MSTGAASALADQARLEPLPFQDLAGWEADDHDAAFRAFLRSCRALEASAAELRPAQAPQADLLAVCREALKTPDLGRAEARRFFETHFQPVAVTPRSGDGFLTGYYEPEFQGSRTPDATYRVPLLDRPADLVTIPQGETLPGLDKGLQAARRSKDGYEPYPDRAAIEEGALGTLARPIVYLREPGEAFIIHVQGSARIRLDDGSVMRVAYAGRNGRPYTSIGRLLVQRGEMDLETMTLEKLMGWLKSHPEPAKALMRQNQSYIFFREAGELAPEDGPIGGAGTPLVPGRSLAVDRSLWTYGLPVWLDGQLPLSLGEAEPLRRLMIAQDTGSAIVGPARGDFFFGSGEEAGRRAGLLRHAVRFVVLQPKSRS